MQIFLFPLALVAMHGDQVDFKDDVFFVTKETTDQWTEVWLSGLSRA